ncbi:MAG: LamG domain-containing protein [Alphaproteobacteria bacterium]|nr:LamG domain-containing protein [Alphaproteobacteria bacterium]
MFRNLPTKAFSFLELSIVIVIIGLLISAILASTELVDEVKLAQARSLTQNSPVTSISNLAFWLDTTSERSFLPSESQDGLAVSRWNDIRPEASAASYFSNSSGATDSPTYKEKCINGLPCLYFSSNSDLLYNGSFGIRTKYITLFMVFTGSDLTGRTILYSDLNADWTQTSSGLFVLFSGASHQHHYYIALDNGVYGQLNAAATLTPKQPYIYSIVDDYSSSIYQYVNGNVANSSGSSGVFTKVLGSFLIGDHWNSCGYQGNIGEIIVFTKTLTTTERKSVEQYLSKKWDIKVSS